MSSKCPGRKQLIDFVSGDFEGAEADLLQVHVDQCVHCEKIINDLREDEVILAKLRTALGGNEKVALQERLQACASGDYEVLGEVGQGVEGVVFKARDVRLDKIVAIKCPANKDQQRRLVATFDEARTMAKVNHPNVVDIYSLEENPEFPFMVMEYVDGLAINEAASHVSLDRRLDMFKQVLRAVTELHKRGIVHRDLKPGNILVDRFGMVKILDMGIADQVRLDPVPGATRIFASGTPAYMAPEQIRGDLSVPAMDVFSLGIILFELLTGQRPFPGANVEDTFQAILDSDPPLPRTFNAEIPGPLQAICLAALEKNPKNRYPTARQFLLDLERFLQNEPVVANPKMLTDILEHGVEKHLDDMGRWHEDRLISTREYGYFAGRYERLRQQEEFWVLDSRRISFSQVMLHLGAWACVVSAFLMLCPLWEHLTKWQRISLPLTIFIVLIVLGLVLWDCRVWRVAVVLLMAASLTLPLCISTMLVTLEWFGPESFIEAAATKTEAGFPAEADNEHLEKKPASDLLEGLMTNIQLLIAVGFWVLLSFVLWCRTKTSAFSLICSLSVLALATSIFSLLGLRDYLKNQEFDIVASGYLIPGVILLTLALALDLRLRVTAIVAPIYIISIATVLLSLTFIALCGPTTEWFGLDQWITDKFDGIAYSLIINGVIYFTLGMLADRSKKSYWLHRIAPLLFWLTPTHVLAPIVYFMSEKKWEWFLLPAGWTLSELVLALSALFFVFTSVPKQMKSFLFSGLFYMAVSVVWLTQEHFKEKFFWPIILASVGLILTLIAWRWPVLFDRNPKKLRLLKRNIDKSRENGPGKS